MYIQVACQALQAVLALRQAALMDWAKPAALAASVFPA
jgi:hypothetical protein